MIDNLGSILVKNEDGFLNGKQLQQKLVHEGVLHPTSDVAVFLKRLVSWNAHKGFTLATLSGTQQNLQWRAMLWVECL